MPEPVPEPVNNKPLLLWWGSSVLGLMACTWPLWTPDRSVPRVPVLSLLSSVPPAIDYLLLALVGYGLLRLFLRPSGIGQTLTAIGLAGLMTLDQLRWQPWAYHLLLFAVLLPKPTAYVATLDPLRWLRHLAVSIYAYSAVSKLNYAFATTLGQQMLQSQLSWLGIDLESLPSGIRTALAIAMPLGEFAVALILLVRPRLGAYFAIVFHGFVLLTLSPVGLGHSLGVLVWNALFAIQTWMLFTPKKPSEDQGESSVAWRFDIRLLAFLAAILFPAAHYMAGIGDRWPAWGLYAPSGEQATLYVHRTTVSRLPETLQEHVEVDGTGDEGADWYELSLADLTLAETGAPLYPQNRIATGLSLALAEKQRWGDYVRVDISSPANWLSGDRKTSSLVGQEALREQAARYWINTKAQWSQPLK